MAGVAASSGRAPLADEVRVTSRGGPPPPGAALEVGGDGFTRFRLPWFPGLPTRWVVTVIADAPKHE